MTPARLPSFRPPRRRGYIPVSGRRATDPRSPHAAGRPLGVYQRQGRPAGPHYWYTLMTEPVPPELAHAVAFLQQVGSHIERLLHSEDDFLAAQEACNLHLIEVRNEGAAVCESGAAAAEGVIARNQLWSRQQLPGQLRAVWPAVMCCSSSRHQTWDDFHGRARRSREYEQVEHARHFLDSIAHGFRLLSVAMGWDHPLRLKAERPASPIPAGRDVTSQPVGRKKLDGDHADVRDEIVRLYHGGLSASEIEEQADEQLRRLIDRVRAAEYRQQQRDGSGAKKPSRRDIIRRYTRTNPRPKPGG